MARGRIRTKLPMGGFSLKVKSESMMSMTILWYWWAKEPRMMYVPSKWGVFQNPRILKITVESLEVFLKKELCESCEGSRLYEEFTLPETKSLHQKIDNWKTNFILRRLFCQVLCFFCVRGCKQIGRCVSLISYISCSEGGRHILDWVLFRKCKHKYQKSCVYAVNLFDIGITPVPERTTLIQSIPI